MTSHNNFTTTKLEEKLSSEYKGQLRQIKLHIETEGKEKEISQKFPNYTLHDMDHFIQVAKNVDKLCLPILDKYLDEKHCFCLLAACLCHDLGMSHFDLLNDERYYKMNQDELRKKHANHSSFYVMDELPKTCISDEGLRHAIAKICEGHGYWDWESNIRQ